MASEKISEAFLPIFVNFLRNALFIFDQMAAKYVAILNSKLSYIVRKGNYIAISLDNKKYPKSQKGKLEVKPLLY